MAGVNKTQSYVNNPISLYGRFNVGAVRTNHYVKDTNALQRYNALDRGYGQSPCVEDDANASELLGVTRLREIAIA